MDQPKKFVLIAVPSYTQNVAMEFAASLAGFTAALTNQHIPHAIMFLGGICFIDVARNLCCHKFLQEVNGKKCTDLFFLDDDVGFPPNDAMALMMSDKDIVCGAYPKKADTPKQEFPISVKVDKDNKLIEHDGFFLVDSAPAGFMRIKRHVIEKLSETEDTYHYAGPDGLVELKNIFSLGPRNGMYFGEDTSFAAKAYNAGFDLWAKIDINFSHRGQKVWRGQMKNALSAYLGESNVRQ